MKIGIAGAGIGGLSAAILLHNSGHKATLFDKFERPAPIGSGLVIQPVSFGILAQMGIWPRVLAAGNPITSMFGTEANTDRVVLKVAYGTPSSPNFGLAIHRSSLFSALLDAALDKGVELCTNFEVCARQGNRFCSFTDELSPQFDLLVDASGAHSALTPLVARPLPYGAIWGTVDWPHKGELRRDQLNQVYRRADRMLGVLPVGDVQGQIGEKATIFWSLPRNAHREWRSHGPERWKAEACELWPQIGPFISQITDPNQMTMARYAHGTLMRPWQSGLAFIGDSAHRASPQLGQGRIWQC